MSTIKALRIAGIPKASFLLVLEVIKVDPPMKLVQTQRTLQTLSEQCRTRFSPWLDHQQGKGVASGCEHRSCGNHCAEEEWSSRQSFGAPYFSLMNIVLRFRHSRQFNLSGTRIA
jgi:hypothetical protein